MNSNLSDLVFFFILFSVLKSSFGIFSRISLIEVQVRAYKSCYPEGETHGADGRACPPAGSQSPGPPPSGTRARPRSSWASGRARSSGPRLQQGPQRAARGGWATALGARTSAARAPREAPAPPGPAWGGPSGGGGPRRPRPHGRASGRALTQRVVLLEHPLHGGGEEGTQPALGAAELSAPTTTTTTAAAAAIHGRRDFRLPEPSNREGRGFRRHSRDSASRGGAVWQGAGQEPGLEGLSAPGEDRVGDREVCEGY